MLCIPLLTDIRRRSGFLRQLMAKEIEPPIAVRRKESEVAAASGISKRDLMISVREAASQGGL